MQRVAHRVNDLAILEGLPGDVGAEIDIRASGGRLLLAHEPHVDGPGLTDFLDVYARTRRDNLLILNTKEDGLDDDILEFVRGRRIDNFFFLDLSFPSIVRMSLRGGEKRVALRVSEYESAEDALKLAGKVDWIWLDCFAGEPPDAALTRRLREKFSVCLVSPELEGHPVARIDAFLPLASGVDAVCTKCPDRWR